MFLAELQLEEKKAFLELAYLIANVDGKYSVFESKTIKEYHKELAIGDYTIKGITIENILEEFKSERSRTIVLTELLRLIYSDGVFHEQERESVSLIKKHFGFNPNEYDSFKDWIIKIKELAKYPEY
jgi:tellurite resistance protein